MGVITRDFVVSVAVADYLAMKSATVEGTLLRRMLTAEHWARFTCEVMETFRTRFGDVVEFRRDFLIGIGTPKLTARPTGRATRRAYAYCFSSDARN